MEGWGFPSSGDNKVENYCQASKKWNLTEIEECIRKTYLYVLKP